MSKFALMNKVMYRLILRMVGVGFCNNYRQGRRRRIKNERDTPLMFEDEEGHKIYAVFITH